MSQPKVLLTVEEDDKLVEMVATFPCIYDVTSPVYKDQMVKDNAWKEIAEYVERSAEDCKKRWRNIKDTYQKRQKKGKETGSSAFCKGKRWPLADMLTFLDKVDHKRKSIANIACDDTSTQDDVSLPMGENTATEKVDAPSTTQNMTDTSTQNVDPFRPPSKRQKHNDNIRKLLEARRIERQEIIKSFTLNRDDDVDLFFKSIAMSVKNLRPELIYEAKMRSLKMVFDLENRCSPHFDLPPSASPSSSSNTCMTSPSPSSAHTSNNSSVCDLYDYENL